MKTRQRIKLKRRRAPHKITRDGLSLLEVILAITILGLSMVTIGEIIRIGARSAAVARHDATAQILCDSSVAEIRCGSLPLENVSKAPIASAQSWLYSVTIKPAQLNGLLAIEVIVEQDDTVTQPISFSITRYMPDPDYEESVEAREEALND